MTHRNWTRRSVKGRIIAGLCFGCFALNANVVQAATYIEDFEEPFSSWESEWLGQNSNLQNYYVVVGAGDTSYRGNNPDGLYVIDSVNDGNALITFNPAFGLITSISFDLAAYTNPTLSIFDINGLILFTTVLTASSGFLTDPGVYTNYGASSAIGIGGFSLVGGAEGNVSIDNVRVDTAVVSGVPEPSTWAMMLLGFGAVGYSMRQRRRATLRLLRTA